MPGMQAHILAAGRPNRCSYPADLLGTWLPYVLFFLEARSGPRRAAAQRAPGDGLRAQEQAIHPVLSCWADLDGSTIGLLGHIAPRS